MVIEASFPQADPLDPSGYDEMFKKWTESLREDPTVPCTDIELREIRTIGKREYYEYDEWPTVRQYDIPAPRSEKEGLRPLRIEPDYADAHVFVGMILSQIPGRATDAVGECERALKIRPSHTPARRLLERLRSRKTAAD